MVQPPLAGQRRCPQADTPPSDPKAGMNYGARCRRRSNPPGTTVTTDGRWRAPDQTRRGALNPKILIVFSERFMAPCAVLW